MGHRLKTNFAPSLALKLAFCIAVAGPFSQVACVTVGHMQNKYSLVSAIRNAASGGSPQGYEAEVSQEAARSQGPPSGFWLPFRELTKRDLMNVTTPTQGGDFVQTGVDSTVIPLLRNRMVCGRIGVQIMAGLKGNLALPRQSGASTSAAASEQAALTASTPAVNQQILTPHRIGAYSKVTKQLLLQSSPDAEAFLRNDLITQVAIQKDALILNGSGGASEPTGIFQTAGIGTIAFGGAATWPSVISMETKLTTANADVGRMGFIVDPATRGKWKNAPKVAASTFPIFLWEDGNWNDGTNDGKVNGYRAASTNQIPGSRALFGNFEDCVLALWGDSFDVIVDGFSLAEQGLVRIIVHSFFDVAVLHPVSFCASTDTAAA